MRRIMAIAVGLLATAGARSANAQSHWVLFDDSISTSSCDVINTTRAELVLLDGTFELMIISNRDTIIAGSFVDDSNFVSINGNPVGSIEFAQDGDGFRTLWWLSLDGRVIELDSFTAEPVASDLTPRDFLNVKCDACPLIDNDPAGVCDDPVDVPQIVVRVCGMGMGSNLTLAMGLCGFIGLRSMRRP